MKGHRIQLFAAALLAVVYLSSCEGSILSLVQEDVGSFQSVPVISGINPSFAAAPGDSISISGENFGNPDEQPKVYFSGVEGTVASWDETSIEVEVPDNGGSTITVENSFGESSAFAYQIWGIHDFTPWTVGLFSSGSYRVALGITTGGVGRLIMSDLEGSAKYFESTYSPDTDTWSAFSDLYTGNDEAGYNSGNMRIATDLNTRELHVSWFSSNDKLRYATTSGTSAWSSPSAFVYEPAGQKADAAIAVSPADGAVTIVHSGSDGVGDFYGYYSVEGQSSFTNSASPGVAIHASSPPEVYSVAAAVLSSGTPILASVDRADSGGSQYIIRLVREHTSGSFTTGFFAGNDTGLTSYDSRDDIKLITDSGDRPVILFRPVSNQLVVAMYPGSLPFATRTVSNQSTGFYDIAKDSEGNIYVVYGSTAGELWVDRFDNASDSWAQKQLASLDSGASFVGGISLALGADDSLNIAFMQAIGTDVTARVLYTKP